MSKVNVVKVYIRNSRGEEIKITHIKVGNIDDPFDLDLKNGEPEILEVNSITPLNGNTGAVPLGDPFQLDLIVTYKNIGSGLEHTSTARLRGQQVIQYS